MKKIFSLLLVALTILPMSSMAQRTINVTKEQKKHAFFIGLKAGATFNSMTQPEECDLYDGMGIGFTGSVVAKVRFNQATSSSPAGTGLLGVGLELGYRNSSVKTIGTDEKGNENAKFSLGYFDIPVYVQIYPFYKSNAMNTFHIDLGPEISLIMSRSPKSLGTDKVNAGFSAVNYQFDTDDSRLKANDLRIMAGVGYDIKIKNSEGKTKGLLGINARYHLGTSKMAKNFNSKMNNAEVSVSYLFNAGEM